MVRAAAPHNINRTAAAEYHYYIHNPNSIINKETGFSLDFIIYHTLIINNIKYVLCYLFRCWKQWQRHQNINRKAAVHYYYYYYYYFFNSFYLHNINRKATHPSLLLLLLIDDVDMMVTTIIMWKERQASE